MQFKNEIWIDDEKYLNLQCVDAYRTLIRYCHIFPSTRMSKSTKVMTSCQKSSTMSLCHYLWHCSCLNQHAISLMLPSACDCTYSNTCLNSHLRNHTDTYAACNFYSSITVAIIVTRGCILMFGPILLRTCPIWLFFL